MICQDLYRSIIEYVPLDSLHDLSAASPIFDKVICEMGIKIFYCSSGPQRLTNDHAIVMTSLGKKYLLVLSTDDGNIILVNNGAHINTQLIKYTNEPFAGLIIYYDSTSRMAINWIWGCMHINDDHYMPELYKRSSINYGTSDTINLIDFDAGIVVHYEYIMQQLKDVFIIDHFTVIFKDNNWKQ